MFSPFTLGVGKRLLSKFDRAGLLIFVQVFVSRAFKVTVYATLRNQSTEVPYAAYRPIPAIANYFRIDIRFPH